MIFRGSLERLDDRSRWRFLLSPGGTHSVPRPAQTGHWSSGQTRRFLLGLITVFPFPRQVRTRVAWTQDKTRQTKTSTPFYNCIPYLKW